MEGPPRLISKGRTLLLDRRPNNADYGLVQLSQLLGAAFWPINMMNFTVQRLLAPSHNNSVQVTTSLCNTHIQTLRASHGVFHVNGRVFLDMST